MTFCWAVILERVVQIIIANFYCTQFWPNSITEISKDGHQGSGGQRSDRRFSIQSLEKTEDEIVSNKSQEVANWPVRKSTLRTMRNPSDSRSLWTYCSVWFLRETGIGPQWKLQACQYDQKKEYPVNTSRFASQQSPLIIRLIAAFYFFGASMLFVSCFANRAAVSHNIAERHGLPPVIEPFILPIVGCLALLISFGLYQCSRWGFYLTSAYLVYFGVISLWLSLQKPYQPYIGNASWALFVLSILVWKRKLFLSKRGVNDPC